MNLESLPEHIRRPHLRRIQPVPLTKDGQQFVALRDPAMLVEQTIVIPAVAMQAVQHFRGEQTLDDLCRQLGGNIDQFADLANRLDQVGLLWGPTFDGLEAKQKEKLSSRGAFPVRASASLGKTAEESRKALDEFFEQSDDPEIEGEVVGLVGPHLDYARGWPNYAGAYFPLRQLDAPDRVVILGTNHFGLGDGVVLSELGFESPLGLCPPDKPVVQKLVSTFGRPLVVDQLDHMPEHSIELHLPWIQYCWGNVPVVAALVPDPLIPMIEDDTTQRVALEPFVAGLREALEEVGGRTFVIASSDLSHVGPQFGEPRAVDQQRRIDVEKIDRDLMGKYLSGDAEEFLSALRWCNNPNRWCSIGNMTAALMLAQPSSLELIDYRQALDEKGMGMVSSAAMAMLK